MVGTLEADLSAAPMRPIEAIMNYGSKESTYKLALIRAMNDWVIEHAADQEGDHHIPLSWIAMKFLEYYWPLVVEGPVVQMAPKRSRKLQIAGFIEGYVERVKTGKGLAGVPGAERLPESPDHWARLSEVLLHDPAYAKEVQSLILKTRRQVLDQPVRYVRNVSGSQVSFFALQTGEEQDFEAARVKGMSREVSQRLRSARSLPELLEGDPTTFVLPRETFEAIRPLRYCILGSLTAKWYAETERYYSILRRIPPPDLMGRIVGPVSARDTVMAQRYRELYRDHGLAETCVLTGSPLRTNWHLDHVVPWSRFPIESFWNLVPLSKKANQWKSNYLVRIQGDYRTRLETHLEGCLETEHPIVQSDLRRLKTGVGNWSASRLTRHVADVVNELSVVTGMPLIEPHPDPPRLNPTGPGS